MPAAPFLKLNQFKKMKHKLKTITPYFSQIWEGKKTFEVRKNDRDFQPGDTLALKEYNSLANT